ncbi:TetR/AcrR family transcriptional regulator [Nonomuraea sp. PA05]|uniref:TetR family transcriptional regulator n=1 Tax=Nonomuraea sp. PA05 TaxID=2604466 RepID=UPI0011D301F5|nr:TetR family transcriptional regulator [Nonomuraea sp. PA05]TYB64753.1 TetR/AcrR family transcriptional regulator [Nonomuraea sp. PA05]
MASTDSTRDRIVAAAQAEFARHGIAGARVDRIAKAARSSKERVYAYFRSKEELYGFVAARELAVAAEAIHLDPTDLPAYAGQMFDYFTAHPDRYRFIAWGRLELTSAPAEGSPDLYRRAILGKVEKIRRAQQAGDLDPSWDPIDVMALITQIAVTWIDQSELAALTRHAAADPALAARRAAVMRAVTTIFPPARES